MQDAGSGEVDVQTVPHVAHEAAKEPPGGGGGVAEGEGEWVASLGGSESLILTLQLPGH